MASTNPFDSDLSWLDYLLAAVLVVATLYLLRRLGWLSRRHLLIALNEIAPWLFMIWFVLGLTDCMGAVSRIGVGSTDVRMSLFVGMFAGPILFVVSLFVRQRIRRRLLEKKPGVEQDAA